MNTPNPCSRLLRPLATSILCFLSSCGSDSRRAAPAHAKLGNLTPVTRVTSDSTVELTRGWSIDVDSHGRIYVADASDIAVLGPDGRLVRRIGRAGSGPGEFRGLASLRILPGDTLMTFDSEAARVSVFNPVDGRALTTANLSTPHLVFPYWVAPVAGRRSFVAAYRAAYGMSANGGSRHEQKEIVRLLNADASLQRDSVLSFPEYEAVPVRSGGNTIGELFDPFGRQTLLATDGDRLYTAWTGSTTVEVHTVSGQLVKAIHPAASVPTRPISRLEMDSVIHEMTNPVMPEPVIRRAMESVPHRDWPILQDMLVDDAGRIWLAETGLRGEPLHWMAFDQDGALLARFDVPVSVSIRLIRGMTAYGISRDENDVPRVVVYDLKPTTPSPAKRS